MPSFKYFFSESIWSIREFFRTPRKIYATFPAITIFAFWRIIFEYRRVLNYAPESNLLPLVLFSLFTIVFAFVICYLGSALIKKSQPKFWIAKYLAVIGLSVSPMEIFLLVALDRSNLESAVAFFRLVLLVSVTESIAGYLIAQVQKRTKELESHQKSLISAEEEFRSLISSHLHDNLQTRLVAIGIQLNQIRDSLNENDSAKIMNVIEDIEDIRAQEVRDFGKGITPNFQVDNLETSLQRLFSRYKDVIDCRLHNMEVFETNGQASQTYFLGIYRIIEQALLNSLAHGTANHLEVQAQISSIELFLKISNNGILYEPHTSMQGHGFAVIDAWVTKFDGAWSISNQDEQVVIELRWKL